MAQRYAHRDTKPSTVGPQTKWTPEQHATHRAEVEAKAAEGLAARMAAIREGRA